MNARPPRGLVAALIAVLAAFGGLAVGVTVSDEDGDGRRDRVTVDVRAPQVPTRAKVDGPDADGALDDTLTVPPAAAEAVERDLKAGQAELNRPLREPGDGPVVTQPPGPLAADEVPGCRTRFVGNSSSRGGVRPSLIVLHQTVSRERGAASQDALTAYASRRSSGVSWHLLVGRAGGLCTYTVPLALKAWTQGNANPYAVGIEVEAYGDEGAYVTGAGKRRLVSVVRHVARRYGIPLRRGAIDRGSCRPTRSGIIEHSDAGACGGGHVDVTLSPGDAASTIAAAARAAGGSSSSSSTPNTATERRRCGALRFQRRKVRGGASWSDRIVAYGTATTRGRRAGFLRRALERSGVDTRRQCR